MNKAQSNSTKLDILIVDDDLGSLRALSALLTKQGYEVRRATDGPTALMIAAADPPDLILLDVLMPAMDGVEVCRQLKSNAETREIPVIFCSALGEVVDIIRGFEAGGVDYITKPYNAAEVEVRVKTHLDLYWLRRELSQRNAELQREIQEREQAQEALRESEARLELAVAGSGGGLWHIELDPDDPSYALPDEIYLSPRLKGFLGYEDDEFPNSMAAWESRILPEDLPGLRERSRKYRQGEIDRYELEYRIRHKDGSVLWLRTTGLIERDQDGRPVRFAGIDWDITAHKEAEEALRYQATLLSSVSDAVITTGLDFTIQSWNSVAEALYGWRAEEVIGEPMGQVVPTEYPNEQREAVLAQFQAEGVWQGETIQKHKDGSDLYVLASVTLVRDDTGHPISVLAVNRDISERVQAEEALQASQQLLQSSLDALSAHIAILDGNGTILVVNDSWCRFADQNGLGWDDYGVGRNYLEVTESASGELSDGAHEVANGIRQVMAGQREEFWLEYPCHSPEEERWFVQRVTRFESREGVRVVTSHEDITQRKQAEEALRESEKRFRALFQGIPVPVYAWQRIKDGFVLVDHNDAAEVITGGSISSFLGTTATAMYADRPDIVEDMSRCFAEKTSIQREIAYQFMGTGESRVLVAKYAFVPPDLVLVHTEDITERKRVQNALQERSRELAERVKELNCLYGISALIEKPGISLEEILQGTVDLIPPAWQYPDVTCARISVNGQEFRSERFQETAWGQDSPLVVYGEQTGRVEVYYLEERPQSDEGPFISEERALLDAIAERLSRVIERFAAEEARQQRVKEVSTLHHIAQTVAAVGDLTEALESVAEAVAELFDARSTLFAVPDYEDAELQALAGFERESGPYSTTGVAFSLEETPFSRQILDRGQPFVLPDFQAISLAPTIRAFVRERDLQTMLFVPLRARGTVVGLMAVGSDQPGRTFTPEEIVLAETIASDVAAALENARLAEQARSAAVDAERQRLARELHDSVTQSLYSLTLLSQGWGTMAARGRLEDPVGSFQRLSQVGQQALKEMRLMIHQLRPPILEEVGLVGALRQRLEAVEQRANVEARLFTQGDVGDLPNEVEEQLFHIAQEALNNALRHAAATGVIVRIEVEADEVLLSVEDDGVGFDPSADSAGMGLVTMQERAEAIGGGLTVVSVPEQGTTVEVTVALELDEGV